MMQRYQLNQHETEVIEHVVRTVLSIGRDNHFDQKFDMAFNNLDYHTANGQDKMVVIPIGLDWVVKFGLHKSGDARCLPRRSFLSEVVVMNMKDLDIEFIKISKVNCLKQFFG